MAVSSTNELQFGPSFMRRANRQASGTFKSPSSSTELPPLSSPGSATAPSLGHFSAPSGSPGVNGAAQNNGVYRPSFSAVAASDRERNEEPRHFSGTPNGVIGEGGVAGKKGLRGTLEYSRETLLELYSEKVPLEMPQELEQAEQSLAVLISDQPVGPPLGLVEMTEAEKELFAGPFNSDRRNNKQQAHAAGGNGDVASVADGRLPGPRLDKRRSTDRFGGRESGMGIQGGVLSGVSGGRKRGEHEAEPELSNRRESDVGSGGGSWGGSRDRKVRDPNEGWGSKWKRASLEGGDSVPRYSVLDRMREKANAEAAARERTPEVAEDPEEDLAPGVADMSIDRSDASKSFVASNSASPVSVRQEIPLPASDASALQQPTLANPLDEPLESVPWQYRDPSGTVQGPFTAFQMQEWHKASFFRDDLLVKRVADAAFETLETLMLRTGNRDRPFLTKAPPSAPPNLPPPAPQQRQPFSPQLPQQRQQQLFSDRPAHEQTSYLSQDSIPPPREHQDDMFHESQRAPDPWGVPPPTQQAQLAAPPWEQQHHAHHFGPPSQFGPPSPFGPHPHDPFRFPHHHPDQLHLDFPDPRGLPPTGSPPQHDPFGMRSPISPTETPFNPSFLQSQLQQAPPAPLQHSGFPPSPFLAASKARLPDLNDVAANGFAALPQQHPLPQQSHAASATAPFEEVWGKPPPQQPLAPLETQIQQPMPESPAAALAAATDSPIRRDSLVSRAVAPIGSRKSGRSTPVTASPKPSTAEVEQPATAVNTPTPITGAALETPKKVEKAAELPTPTSTALAPEPSPVAAKSALPAKQPTLPPAPVSPAKESPWAQAPVPSSLPSKPVSEPVATAGAQGKASGLTRQQEEAHRRNASIAKAQQQLMQAQAQERAAKEAAAAAKASVTTPVTTATPTPAPWSASADEKKAGGNGPSLAQIQAAEAKQAAKRKTAEKQAAAVRLAAEQRQAEERAAKEAKESLPSNATWGGAGSPQKPPSPVQAWKSEAMEGQKSGGALSMKQIQEEEAKRKKVAQAAAAAKAMPVRGYAGSVGPAAPKPSAANAGPWSVVGGSKAKLVQPPPATNGKPSGAVPGLPGAPRAPVKPVTAAPTPSAPKPSVQPRTASSNTLQAPKPATSVNPDAPPPASPEFMKWLREALRGMNNVEDFVKMLLDFPLNPDESVLEIISDSVYAGSATLDGRRFAKEFKERRNQDVAAHNPKPSSANGAKGGADQQARVGFTAADALKSAPPASPGNTAFNVVQKKKRR